MPSKPGRRISAFARSTATPPTEMSTPASVSTPRAWGERQRRRPRGSQKATEERVSAEHCIDRGREGEREGGREGGRERGRERRRGRGSGGEADMEMENQMRRLVRCRHAITTTSMIKMIAMTLLELIRAF